MFDLYKYKLEFLRPVLGTNPLDPYVLDTHIIDKQRKLILEKSKVNKEINKYLDQLQITDERKEEEINAIFAKLEELSGVSITSEEKIEALAGNLESLRETFKSFDFKGTTVFYWDKKTEMPCLSDHMIYGFLKASAEAICRTKTTKKGTVLQSASYTQSLINQHVRCEERFIIFSKGVKMTKDHIDYLQRSLRAMTPKGPRVSLVKSEQIEEGATISFTLKVMEGSPLKKDHLDKMFSYGELSGIGQWRNAGYGQFRVVEV